MHAAIYFSGKICYAQFFNKQQGNNMDIREQDLAAAKQGLFWDSMTGLYRKPIGKDTLGPLFEDIGCIYCGGNSCDGFHSQSIGIQS